MSKPYFLHTLQNIFYLFRLYSIGDTFLKIVNLLLGFFLSTMMTTIVSQTGDWGIVAGAIIVTYIELTSKYLCAICFLNTLINRYN